MAEIADIVLELVDEIASISGVNANSVIVIAPNRKSPPPNLVGDRDVLIRPRGFQVDEEQLNAAGRHSMLVRRFVDIIIRCRLELDVNGSDLQFMTKTGVGLLRLESVLLDKIMMWWPVDDDDVGLLVEPARILAADDVTRELISPDPHWGQEGFRLMIKYEQTLTQSIQ